MSTITPIEFELKSGEVILVRSARADDAERVFELAQMVIQEGDNSITEPDEYRQTKEQGRGWILKHTDSPGYLVLVAEIGGTIVGTLNFQNGARRRIAHRGTFSMSVLKEWRDCGVSRALIEALMDWARETPIIEKIYLEVFANSSHEIDLLKKMGFSVEGRRPHSIKLGPGEYVDTLLMYSFVNG